MAKYINAFEWFILMFEHNKENSNCYQFLRVYYAIF